MRLWIPRALRALLVSIALPVAASAQPPAPATPPPPAGTLPPAVPAAPPAAAPAAPVVVMPNGVVYIDPYHIATPYNPTLMNQPVPNPAYNRPITTLPCVNPNQNFDPYVPSKPACSHPMLHKKGCNCEGGCSGGCAGGCGNDHAALHKATHPCEGMCSKGGSCTTCCNTNNFVLASSRSFFGESSREFFERPASPDGIKMCPVKYSPPPAPAAYTPANVVAR